MQRRSSYLLELNNRTLELDLIAFLQVNQVLAQDTSLVALDDQVKVRSGIFGDGSVGAEVVYGFAVLFAGLL